MFTRQTKNTASNPMSSASNNKPCTFEPTLGLGTLWLIIRMIFKIKWKHMEKNVYSTFQKILMKKKSEEKSGFFFRILFLNLLKRVKKNVRTNSNIYIYKYNMYT